MFQKLIDGVYNEIRVFLLDYIKKNGVDSRMKGVKGYKAIKCKGIRTLYISAEEFAIVDGKIKAFDNGSVANCPTHIRNLEEFPIKQLIKFLDILNQK